MQEGRKSPAVAKTPLRGKRIEYIAAVRYTDGSSELVRVRNADDIGDARRLVLAELMNVKSVVIAHRH